MTLGLILLFLAAILVFLGFAQRILDRLHLTDLQALLFLGAMIVGSFINIPISTGRLYFSINVGGGLLPVILAIYLLTRAGTSAEWGRALAASVITGGLIFGISRFFTFEEGTTILDPLYVFGLTAGVVGYIAGRSRRSAFVAAVFGLVLADLANLVMMAVQRIPGRIVLGGAGAFDSIIIAGIIALALAELFGETRERLQGGPATQGERPPGLHDDDMEMAWEEDFGHDFEEEASNAPEPPEAIAAPDPLEQSVGGTLADDQDLDPYESEQEEQDEQGEQETHRLELVKEMHLDGGVTISVDPIASDEGGTKNG